MAAFLVVGSPEEVAAFKALRTKLLAERTYTSNEVTAAEATGARECLRRLMGSLEHEPQFKFDAVHCWHRVPTDNGEELAVYVLRGSDAALSQFNQDIEGLGGECDSVGREVYAALENAAQAFANGEVEDRVDRDRIDVLEKKLSRGYLKKTELDELVALKVAAALEEVEVTFVEDDEPTEDARDPYAAEFEDPFDAAPEPTPKHRSPSDQRYRLRKRYGVTRKQLLALDGASPEGVARLSDRVIQYLKLGYEIVEAIETATLESAASAGGWDWIDRFNRRKAVDMTIPRLVRAGCRLDRAQVLCKSTDTCLEAGLDMGAAMSVAGLYWEAYQQQDPELYARLKTTLTEARYQRFFDDITGKFPGSVAWETPSGATWVARVAADLCNEKKAGRPYTMQEAGIQARAEWENMTRGARLDVRDELHGYFAEVSIADENRFVSVWAKERLLQMPEFDAETADQVVPLIVGHATEGMMTLVEAEVAGIEDWRDNERLRWEADQLKAPAIHHLHPDQVGMMRLKLGIPANLPLDMLLDLDKEEKPDPVKDAALVEEILDLKSFLAGISRRLDVMEGKL